MASNRRHSPEPRRSCFDDVCPQKKSSKSNWYRIKKTGGCTIRPPSDHTPKYSPFDHHRPKLVPGLLRQEHRFKPQLALSRQQKSHEKHDVPSPVNSTVATQIKHCFSRTQTSIRVPNGPENPPLHVISWQTSSKGKPTRVASSVTYAREQPFVFVTCTTSQLRPYVWERTRGEHHRTGVHISSNPLGGRRCSHPRRLFVSPPWPPEKKPGVVAAAAAQRKHVSCRIPILRHSYGTRGHHMAIPLG